MQVFNNTVFSYAGDVSHGKSSRSTSIRFIIIDTISALFTPIGLYGGNFILQRGGFLWLFAFTTAVRSTGKGVPPGKGWCPSLGPQLLQQPMAEFPVSEDGFPVVSVTAVVSPVPQRDDVGSSAAAGAGISILFPQA